MKLLCPLAWLISSTTFAMGARAPLYSAACRSDLRDGYNLGPTMPSGQYAGQCQDNGTNRTLQMRGDVAINISHNSLFYEGTLPAGDIEEVLEQIARFPAPLNFPADHAEMRFHFKHPLTLKTQVPGEGPDVTTRDIIYSSEGHGPRGVGFNLLVGGMKGDYVLAYRLRTVEDLMQNGFNQDIPGNEQDAIPGLRDVQQYRLNIDDAQKAAMLRQALAYGSGQGSFTVYNSLFKNCATELFYGVIDPALGLSNLHFTPLNVTYPAWNTQALAERGILGARRADLPAEKACREAGRTDNERCFLASPSF